MDLPLSRNGSTKLPVCRKFLFPTNPGGIVPIMQRACVQNDSATADSLLGIGQDFLGYWILLLCCRCVDRVTTPGLLGVMPVSDPCDPCCECKHHCRSHSPSPIPTSVVVSTFSDDVVLGYFTQMSVTHRCLTFALVMTVFAIKLRHNCSEYLCLGSRPSLCSISLPPAPPPPVIFFYRCQGRKCHMLYKRQTR